MGKSSSASGTQSPAPAKSPLHELARDPRALRRVHAAVHRFVEQFEAEVDAAVDAARARQLTAIKRIEHTVRYLHSRYLLTDQAAGASPRKPKGLVVEPDFVLGLGLLEALPLLGCLDRLHGAIVALEPYDGVPFNRRPLVLRTTGSKAETRKKTASESATAGPEETALAALDRAGHDLVGLLRGLVERLAARCTTRAARRKRPKVAPSGMLTPPQVARQLGVSPDKIHAWIRKGELHATNVAAARGGRPRYRISENDLANFQKTRQNVKPTPKPPRRRKKDDGVIEFFK
jgi:excisionase family DNA binding protein